MDGQKVVRCFAQNPKTRYHRSETRSSACHKT